MQVRLERDAPPLRAASMHRLECLAAVLARRGLEARVAAPAGRVPRLQVARVRGPARAGDIYVSRCADGTWWFWWAWAERIAVAGELDEAADQIWRTLGGPGGA